ncbi:MAG: carboxypeptidase-like regulatory domain-containing protein, partial [Flavobacteriaceae bacterium]
MIKNFIILFLLTPWVLWGQNQSIQEAVQDTDQPLSFVTILLTPASESQSEPIAATITDDQGRFQLEGLSQGQYTLSVQ